MSVVVDFEGYMIKPQMYIVKELAAYSIDGSHLRGHWVFKPPLPFNELTKKQQLQFSWIAKHIHGFRWEQGDLEYQYFRSVMCFLFDTYTKVYVKGLEKTQFFEFLSNRICYNLDDFDCPKFDKVSNITHLCVYDHSKQHCAVAKVRSYARYLCDALESSPV